MKIGLESQCHHVASAMSCVDLLCNTYNSFPDALIILSKGHGVLAQYVILNELGLIPQSVLDTYYKDGGLTGHPTLSPTMGIHASTGSLGHGLPIGIGYAISNPKRNVVVIMGDGELDEGSNYEAFRIIERLGLTNILAVVDWNDFQGYKESQDVALPKFRKFYSVKGENWGELEGTLKSHYTKVSPELYKLYEDNVKWKHTKKQESVS